LSAHLLLGYETARNLRFRYRSLLVHPNLGIIEEQNGDIAGLRPKRPKPRITRRSSVPALRSSSPHNSNRIPYSERLDQRLIDGSMSSSAGSV
jgi:hypothetical protein